MQKMLELSEGSAWENPIQTFPAGVVLANLHGSSPLDVRAVLACKFHFISSYAVMSTYQIVRAKERLTKTRDSVLTVQPLLKAVTSPSVYSLKQSKT